MQQGLAQNNCRCTSDGLVGNFQHHFVNSSDDVPIMQQASLAGQESISIEPVSNIIYDIRVRWYMPICAQSKLF